MTRAPLNPNAPSRWGPHRKAKIVAAIGGGFLSFEDARARYALSIAEYSIWQREIELFGLEGLSQKKTQQRRRAGMRSPGVDAP